MNPTFLVIMLLGFIVSSQMPNTRTPRTKRLSELGHTQVLLPAMASLLWHRCFTEQQGRGEGGLNLLTSGWQTSSEGMRKDLVGLNNSGSN